MKEFMKIMREDYKVENFTKKDWVSATLFVAGILAVMLLAGWIESM